MRPTGMFPKNTLSFCFLAVLLLFGACKEDPLLDVPSNSNDSDLKTILADRSIVDLAVTDAAVYFQQENENFVIYDRFDREFAYKSTFNSTIDPTLFVGLEKIERNKVLLGDRDNGLRYFDGDEFKVYLQLNNLIMFDKSCNLCYSSSFAVAFLSEKNQLVAMPHGLDKLGDELVSVASCNDTAWIGSVAGGLTSVSIDAEIDKHNTASGVLADDSVVDVRFDSKRNLHVLTRTGLSRRTNGNWQIIKSPDGVRNNYLSTSNNTLTIGTDQGVFWLQDSSMAPYKALNKLLERKRVNVVEWDNENRLWIGSSQGLFTYKSNP